MLDTITNISKGDVQLIKNGSISESIISGNSGDIKINKMEIYSNIKYSTLSDYHVLVSLNKAFILLNS